MDKPFDADLTGDVINTIEEITMDRHNPAYIDIPAPTVAIDTFDPVVKVLVGALVVLQIVSTVCFVMQLILIYQGR